MSARNTQRSDDLFLAAFDSPGAQRRRQQRGQLQRMTPQQRMAAYHRGNLSTGQLYTWASLWPHEPPQINGEWAWIAQSTPEVADA